MHKGNRSDRINIMTPWADSVARYAKDNWWATAQEVQDYMVEQNPDLLKEKDATLRQLVSRVIGKADYMRRKVVMPDVNYLDVWVDALKEMESERPQGSRLIGYRRFRKYLISRGIRPPYHQQWKLIVALSGVPSNPMNINGFYSYTELIEILTAFLEVRDSASGYTARDFAKWTHSWHGSNMYKSVVYSLAGGSWPMAKGIVFYTKKSEDASK